MNKIVECKGISKFYDGVPAVMDLSLNVQSEEIIALLGPSGCGKSTTLRMIAGFEEPDTGSIRLEGEEVNGKHKFIPPEKRGIGMVFQDFALFPHLTIGKNIAFGLKGTADQKRLRTCEMLELIGMTGMEDQMPNEISGGQQQRVAVGRALAQHPKVMLLDEPFSSLDFQLRLQLRNDIKKVFRKEKVSTILVTHDQYEAFSFADRIIMMNKGKIVQQGTPTEIYRNPASSWVANFVGGANIISAQVKEGQLHSELGIYDNETEGLEGNCHLMIRPEDLRIERVKESCANAVITRVVFLGNREVLWIRLNSGQEIKAQVHLNMAWNEGDHIQVSIDYFKVFTEVA